MYKRSFRLCVLAVALAAVLPAAPAAAAAAPDLPVWGSVPSANRGDRANALLGIDIISPADIWAVGEYRPAGTPAFNLRRTLAQHWDGSGWQLVPTPNLSFPGIDFANLESVSGAAADDVWAVGHGDDFATLRSRTLIEHWDGARWRIVPSPNPAGPNLPNQLFDVLARSASDVWAVGEQGSSGSALILRFDGTGWQPVPNSCGAGLRGITDVPGTDTLWAVGENTTCFFDGQQWSPVSQPGFPDLEGVSAVSATDVWAAGSEVFCPPEICYFESVIQRWNGSQWRAVPHPLASELTDIEVVTGADVWAVGSDDVGTVIQHWDGTRWTDVPSPDPDDGGRLDAIDAQGGGTMWSAGAFYADDADQRTLILQAPSATQGQVVGKTNVGQSPVSWFGPVSGTTTTDVFGNYSIAGLPAGKYTLTVTYAFPGTCDPQSARVTVVANQTTVQDFQLDC